MSVLIVGLGATRRAQSSTERLLASVLQSAETAGARTVLLGADALELPMYAPEDPHRTAEAVQLVEMLRAADGVVIASPGYHGTLSGLVKNALDYVEDMREDVVPYLDGKPVGTVACAYGWPAAIHTLAAIRSVVHALRAWPTPMGAGINTADDVLDDDGRVVDAKAKFQLDLVGKQVVEFAAMRRAAAGERG